MPRAEFKTRSESIISSRKLAVCVAAFSLLMGNSAVLAYSDGPSETFDIASIYPNAEAVAQGLHLEGFNVDPTQGGKRAVLWFEVNGSAFRQHAIDPADPNASCQWDALNWVPGKHGRLEYTETYDDCGPYTKDFVYEPGLVFAPKYWQPGQRWSIEGVSKTKYFENGHLACSGLNRWRSYSASQTSKPNTQVILHTHTTELQTWSPVPGSPPSDLCPQTGTYKWNENFSFSKSIPVENSDGEVIGYQTGLAGSLGGNATSPGGTHWDVQLSSWQALPTSSK